ncbi:hypothetical protein SNEBB_008417 [Seison nebaliae]|nr:hypothetical protein SNEBB_008417 [Seison nebaliae]
MKIFHKLLLFILLNGLSKSINSLMCRKPCSCGVKQHGLSYIYCSHRALKKVPQFHTSSVFFEELVLNGNEIKRIEKNAFKGIKVHRLKIEDNPIEYIDDEAFEELANNLDELIIDVNPSSSIRSIPLSIQNKLQNLKKLQLRGFNFSETRLENSFKKLIKLNTLSLINCNVRQLSYRTFADLQSTLLHLTISHNHKLLKFPTAAIRRLSGKNSQLIKLDLSHNRIEKITDKSFASLKNLRVLDLSYNGISSISNLAFGLGKNVPVLQKLFLQNNGLDHIPSGWLHRLSKTIEELNLNFNRISFIEQNSFLLKHSQHQHSSRRSNFNDRSSSISKNEKLRNKQKKNLDEYKKFEVLSLEGNSITEIERFAFFGLGRLKQLNLDRNSLKVLRKETFAGMSSIELISLSRNRKLKLEKDVFNGMKLRHLYMSSISLTNKNEQIFDELNKLENLESLIISSNLLFELPKKLFLKNLKKLDISKNRLCSFDVEWFEKHKQLTYVNAMQNKILCDCRLNRFIRYFQENRINGTKNFGSCYLPKQMKNNLLENVKIEELDQVCHQFANLSRDYGESLKLSCKCHQKLVECRKEKLKVHNKKEIFETIPSNTPVFPSTGTKNKLSSSISISSRLMSEKKKELNREISGNNSSYLLVSMKEFHVEMNKRNNDSYIVGWEIGVIGEKSIKRNDINEYWPFIDKNRLREEEILDTKLQYESIDVEVNGRRNGSEWLLTSYLNGQIPIGYFVSITDYSRTNNNLGDISRNQSKDGNYYYRYITDLFDMNHINLELNNISLLLNSNKEENSMNGNVENEVKRFDVCLHLKLEATTNLKEEDNGKKEELILACRYIDNGMSKSTFAHQVNEKYEGKKKKEEVKGLMDNNSMIYMICGIVLILIFFFLLILVIIHFLKRYRKYYDTSHTSNGNNRKFYLNCCCYMKEVGDRSIDMRKKKLYCCCCSLGGSTMFGFLKKRIERKYSSFASTNKSMNNSNTTTTATTSRQLIQKGDLNENHHFQYSNDNQMNYRQTISSSSVELKSSTNSSSFKLSTDNTHQSTDNYLNGTINQLSSAFPQSTLVAIKSDQLNFLLNQQQQQQQDMQQNILYLPNSGNYQTMNQPNGQIISMNNAQQNELMHQMPTTTLILNNDNQKQFNIQQQQHSIVTQNQPSVNRLISQNKSFNELNYVPHSFRSSSHNLSSLDNEIKLSSDEQTTTYNRLLKTTKNKSTKTKPTCSRKKKKNKKNNSKSKSIDSHIDRNLIDIQSSSNQTDIRQQQQQPQYVCLPPQAMIMVPNSQSNYLILQQQDQQQQQQQPSQDQPHLQQQQQQQQQQLIGDQQTKKYKILSNDPNSNNTSQFESHFYSEIPSYGMFLSNNNNNNNKPNNISRPNNHQMDNENSTNSNQVQNELITLFS